MCLLRKILYVFAIAIILLLVSPYFSGMIIKNRLTNMVSNLSSSPAFDVVMEDYTQGWRHSRANFTVSVFNPFMEYRATRAHSNLALKFNVICYITHGPVLFPRHLMDLNTCIMGKHLCTAIQVWHLIRISTLNKRAKRHT